MVETTTRADRPSAQEPPSGWARLPMIPGPWETLVIAWRRLRRMSTALLLLFSLIAYGLFGNQFIPDYRVVATSADGRRMIPLDTYNIFYRDEPDRRRLEEIRKKVRPPSERSLPTLRA